MSRDAHWTLSSACEIHYDREVPCVVMVWQGYFTSPEFRAANERVLALLRETASSKLLGDVTNFTLIGAGDQRWLNDDWIPRAIGAGLRACALVQPVYYFNKVAVDSVARQVDPARLSIGYFNDRASARDWLRAG
jgi:hypothetical protein